MQCRIAHLFALGLDTVLADGSGGGGPAGAGPGAMTPADPVASASGSGGCVFLSAGQQQLLGLARVLLRRGSSLERCGAAADAADAPPRILILDEAASSLDPEGTSRLQEAVAALKGGRTLVQIAHRKAVLDRLDRVVVLAAGRVAYDGPPGEAAHAALTIAN